MHILNVIQLSVTGWRNHLVTTLHRPYSPITLLTFVVWATRSIMQHPVFHVLLQQNFAPCTYNLLQIPPQLLWYDIFTIDHLECGIRKWSSGSKWRSKKKGFSWYYFHHENSFFPKHHFGPYLTLFPYSISHFFSFLQRTDIYFLV